MFSTSFRAAVSAFFFAGALGLASTGAAQAQSIMKQCGDEWKAAKANNTTNGATWPQFLKQCRAEKEGAAAPAPAPAAAPAPAPAAAPAPAPAPTYQPKPKPMQAARPTGAGQFSSEAEAKARCPGDTVVWINTKGKSHTYHYSGTRWYGTTKQGAYMCEADAGAAGYHASKSRTEQPKQQP
jgi:plastocyanin